MNEIHFDALTPVVVDSSTLNSCRVHNIESMKRSAAQKTRDRKKLRESFFAKIERNSAEGGDTAPSGMTSIVVAF